VATDRRPYHRTADSVGGEHWSNDELACITRFSAHLHTRWRTERIADPDQAARATFGVADLMRLTGKLTLTSARRLVDLCAKLVSWSVHARGVLTEIHWPKWPEFQGLTPRSGGDTGVNRSPSASSVQRPASSVPKEEEELPPVDVPDGPSSKAPGDSPLLNLLSKLDGDRAEKIAWLADTGPQIEVDAASYSKPVPSLTVSYYRRYLGGERRFKNATENANRAARVAAKMGEFKLQGLI